MVDEPKGYLGVQRDAIDAVKAEVELGGYLTIITNFGPTPRRRPYTTARDEIPHARTETKVQIRKEVPCCWKSESAQSAFKFGSQAMVYKL